MAASAIDEAVRNCVAVGADPSRIAILDNFCWGYTDRPETLGSLVRASIACREVALGLGTPFISGKDSLNNEFSYLDVHGNKQTIAIPPTLLISALGQVEDVRACVTMDAKRAGSMIYLVGVTKDEMGGSHFSLTQSLEGGQVPTVDVEVAKRTFQAVHDAIRTGTVRSCHDLSEGGLAVAAAEMAFAGGLGIEIDLSQIPSIPNSPGHSVLVKLFSESNTRFLFEVAPNKATDFESHFAGLSHACVGRVMETDRLVVKASSGGDSLIDADLMALKEAWQSPLRW
jgi:phosphoribosylformylglycinamidine synthase